MSIQKTGWAASLLLAATLAQAQDETALRQAEQRGLALFDLQRATQAALDAGHELRRFQRKQNELAGWVAESHAGITQVTFFERTRKGRLRGLFQIALDQATAEPREVMRSLDEQPLNPALSAQAEARLQAEAEHFTRCAAQYEVLPMPATDGGWQVYLLPRPAFDDVHIFGGSHRIDFDAQGTATPIRSLSAECHVLQDNPDAEALAFEETQGEQPNELHVLIAQRIGKPLYITTTQNGQTWLIENARIQRAR